MGKDTPAWAAALGGFIVTGIFVMLALVAAGGWTWFRGFLENSAPAWVQAIGSVVAIGAAVSIADRQHRRDVKLRRDAELEKEVLALSSIASGLFYARASLRCLQRNESVLVSVTNEMSSFRNHIGSLAKIPVLDIPDWFATAAIAESMTALDRLDSKMQQSEDDGRLLVRAKIHSEIDIAESILHGCENILRVTLKRRGEDLPHQTYRLNGEVIHTTDPKVIAELKACANVV